MATTPFPFAELAADGSTSDLHDRRPDAMAFTVFGSDAGKEVEPARRYTEDDLAQAVDEARRATALTVEAELRETMTNDVEQRRCDMLAAIRDQFEQQTAMFDERLTRLAGASQQLAVALAKAVLPRAIERQPLVDITDALKATLVRLASEPSIELRLPPDLVAEGTTLLADLAKDVSFKGEVVTIADPALVKGDVVLRWKGGAVDRRMDRLEAEALDLVDRWLHAPSGLTDDDGAPMSGDGSDQTNEMGPANE